MEQHIIPVIYIHKQHSESLVCPCPRMANNVKQMLFILLIYTYNTYPYPVVFICIFFHSLRCVYYSIYCLMLKISISGWTTLVTLRLHCFSVQSRYFVWFPILIHMSFRVLFSHTNKHRTNPLLWSATLEQCYSSNYTCWLGKNKSKEKKWGETVNKLLFPCCCWSLHSHPMWLTSKWNTRRKHNYFPCIIWTVPFMQTY